MSFFKEFKDDLSQAVNELLPNEMSEEEGTEEQMVNTLDTENTAEPNVDSKRMNEILDGFTDHIQDETAQEETAQEETVMDGTDYEQDETEDAYIEENEEKEGDVMGENMEENMDDNVDMDLLASLNASKDEEFDDIKEDLDEYEMEEAVEEETPLKVRAAAVQDDDEVTIISKGTVINGSISSVSSLEIMGTITGDVECLGKLSITGKMVGDASASEVYVNTERLEGSITSEGSVKVGLGTVIIGDIAAASGVIAGAVKGEIDVKGPIVIDSTAIIKGNIKAKSVQINNGAVIEGFCSLSYAEVDVDNIFE